MSIACEDLTKVYEGGKAGWPALRGLTFSIAPGEFAAVTGPSGCGKSTLLNRMSALENVCLPMLYAGADRPAARERAAALLKKVGLHGKEKKPPLELSGGERQRVAIARALSNSPKLILADEPTGNLDSVSSREIMDSLFALNAEGITVVMVTHDKELAARAGRNIRMRDGRIEP